MIKAMLILKGKGMKQAIFIYCTVPYKACVSFGSPVQSIYRWQGVIEEAMELALTIKTVRENYSAIEELIVSLHPYDVPEIVAVELDNGLKPYLDWIVSETE